MEKHAASVRGLSCVLPFSVSFLFASRSGRVSSSCISSKSKTFFSLFFQLNFPLPPSLFPFLPLLLDEPFCFGRRSSFAGHFFSRWTLRFPFDFPSISIRFPFDFPRISRPSYPISRFNGD